ncbi:MAG: hypothetical protein Q9211_001146 [Gyalolechia sp. 1 TL-2023]
MERHTDTYVDDRNRILDGCSKNDPKFRITRVPPQTEGDDPYVRQVCEMMLQDRAIRQLNLVIPTGCYFMGRVEYNHPMTGKLVKPQHPFHLLPTTEINLVVENGACIDLPYVFTQVDILGWNLVCHPGASLRSPSHTFRGRQLGELYVRKHYKYGFLEGIATMLGAEEEFDVLEEESDSWARAKLEDTYGIRQRILRDAPPH